MAPKRRDSLPGASVTRRKRTIKKSARQSSPNSESTASPPRAAPSPPSPAETPGSSSRIDPLAGRIITMGRKVDFGFLDSEGFNLGRQLRHMGWETICSLDLPTYPSLVKDFYLNLARGDGGLVSSIRGTRVHLTSQILGNLLEMPVDGVIGNVHSDRGAALSRFLGRQVEGIEEVKANQLPLELRLLHNICSRVLFPKTGRFEYVSERDIVVMDCVITGQPLNLSGMIIWHMADIGHKTKTTLPYGMILTKVFRSQGVEILEDEPKKNLRHTDYYNLATLHRMGFVKTNGIWERKKGTEERMTETGVHGTPEAGPSARHMSPGPSSPAPQAPTPVPSTSAQPPTGFTDAQMEQLKSIASDLKEELKKEIGDQISELKDLINSLKN